MLSIGLPFLVPPFSSWHSIRSLRPSSASSSSSSAIENNRFPWPRVTAKISRSSAAPIHSEQCFLGICSSLQISPRFVPFSKAAAYFSSLLRCSREGRPRSFTFDISFNTPGFGLGGPGKLLAMKGFLKDRPSYRAVQAWEETKKSRQVSEGDYILDKVVAWLYKHGQRGEPMTVFKAEMLQAWGEALEALRTG